MVSSTQCTVTGPYREEEGEENRTRGTRTHHLEAGFIRVRQLVLKPCIVCY